MKNNEKKERKMIVYFNLNKSTSLHIPEVGNYKIETNINNDEKNSYDVLKFYERDSGKAKIVERFTNNNNQILFNAEDMVLNYDYTFVVDTNYKCINGIKKCVGAIGCLFYDDQKNRFGLQKLSHYYFELNDLEINPECITWAKLINEINQSDIAGYKILLVVDSDLGNYTKYNQGKEMYNGVKLSKNMKIAYASADKKDDLFNLAIAQCDRGAKNLLEKYIKM